MVRKTIFVYDDTLSRHTLSDTHPMKPERLRYTYELLDSYNAFAPEHSLLVPPRSATEEEILQFHSRDYLEEVKKLSSGELLSPSPQFNFGPGDNPPYSGMYEAATRSTGASMTAVGALLSNEADAAFSISGGLHQAMPGYTYGFCIFNDPVIAIQRLVQEGLKVVYVDIDCHHGDGVQHAFYDTDAVLTISMHESGKFLFPGTGFPEEVGEGKGRGYAVNVPLYPYTSDDVYLWAFKEIVEPLVERFRPDVLVTQLGIDSHFLDPITHMALTTQGHNAVVAACAVMGIPKWLALGGGGYDLQAVARAWTLDYAVMSGQVFADEIPDAYQSSFQIETLRDNRELAIQETVVNDTRKFAEDSVKAVQGLIFPIHGLSTV